MEDNIVYMKDTGREPVDIVDEIKKEIPEMTEVLDNFDGDVLDLLGGVEFFSTILEMDDEQFATLEPSFVKIFEETLNERSTRDELFLISKQQNLSLDELNFEFATIIEAIDQLENYTQLKKDFIKKLVAMLLDTFEQVEDWKTEVIKIPCELSDDARIPSYANEGDAGLDIYALDDYTINPGETRIIPTGIKCAIPKNYAILIQPRSGLSVKSKLRIANTPGLIDSGYRDEIGVIIENIEPPIKDIEYEFDDKGEIHIKSILHGSAYTIGKGQRFAQMRLVRVPTAAFFKVESVRDIGVDRKGGFGSSGE